MLSTFLKDNKLSLAKLAESDLLKSHEPPMTNVCCRLFGREEKRPEVPPMVASPNHQRKKIFQEFSSPETTVTAEFGQKSNRSEVESYNMPFGYSPF